MDVAIGMYYIDSELYPFLLIFTFERIWHIPSNVFLRFLL